MKNKQEIQEVKYAGFKSRFYASAIDSILVLPILYLFFPEAFTLHITPELNVLINNFSTNRITQEEFTSQFIAMYMQRDYVAETTNSLIHFVVVGILVITFWIYRSATPGKILLSMKIVDEKTGKAPTNTQLIKRYLGYIVSGVPLFLGFFWIIFDKKKQGWHDKLADTVVVYTKNLNSKEEKERRFKRQTYIAIIILLLFLIFYKF